MQNDQLMYDMYKRRVDSGLTYQTGDMRGSSYCTGDGFNDPRMPMYGIQQQRMPPPFYGGTHEYDDMEGGARSCWTDYRHKQAGKNKSMEDLQKGYLKYKCPPVHYKKPASKAKKGGKKMTIAQKKKLADGKKKFNTFFKKMRKMYPNSKEVTRSDILCMWHDKTGKPSKRQKLRDYCDKWGRPLN